MIELMSHHDHYFTAAFSVKREGGFDATTVLDCIVFGNIEIAF